MNLRIVREITDFIFVEDEPEKADVIFIPGGSYPELPERAARLWKEGYAPYLVPSGRYSITCGAFGGVKSKTEIYQGQYDTECAFYTDVLLRNGVNAESIFQENEAQYTAQNARFSKRLLEERGIRPQKEGEAALTVFRAIGLSVYARADFIVTQDGTPYFLEINTLPGMTPTSLVPQEAAAAGIDYGQLCETIIQASLAARKGGL